MVTRDYLTLVEALGLPKGSIVALVGGGGKTTTLFRLARECTREGCRVLATTTARMKMEELAEMRDVLLWDERDATGETWRSHRAHSPSGRGAPDTRSAVRASHVAPLAARP